MVQLCNVVDGENTRLSYFYLDSTTEINLIEGEGYWGCFWEFAEMAEGFDLGTDLTNDHPVSVVYDPTVAGLRPESTLISTIDPHERPCRKRGRCLWRQPQPEPLGSERLHRQRQRADIRPA